MMLESLSGHTGVTLRHTDSTLRAPPQCRDGHVLKVMVGSLSGHTGRALWATCREEMCPSQPPAMFASAKNNFSKT